MPQLLLAMDGKVEWAKMTNPFGSKKEEEKEQPKPMSAFIAHVAKDPRTKIHGHSK